MSNLFRAAALTLVLLCACATPDVPREPMQAPSDCSLGVLFDALPSCPDRQGDGRIDVAHGCADGGCVEMTAPQLDLVWGAAPTCARTTDAATLFCSWAGGISAHFDDDDRDGVPDPTSKAGALRLEAPFSGTTPEGLGPDAPQSCFLKALGDPDVVTAVDDDAGYTFRYMGWTGDGVYVYDPRGDGIASIVALGGAR